MNLANIATQKRMLIPMIVAFAVPFSVLAGLLFINISATAGTDKAGVADEQAVMIRSETGEALGDEAVVEAGLYRGSSSMSPAQAAVDGKPALLYFYPFEMCQIRYCRQPADLKSELEEAFGDRLNFVPIMTYAGGRNGKSLMTFDNWDLYPVPPYDEWVPQAEATIFGHGLDAPVTVLVDETGQRAAQASEFVNVAEIGEMLKVTATAER